MSEQFKISRMVRGVSPQCGWPVKLARPKIDSAAERKVRKQLAKGVGILKVAKSLGIGTGTAPAHLKGASNEPARGGAMTSGPQLTNSLLRRA
jgi:hypothetical protein